MAHELEINGERTRFAYANHTSPWHRLGVPMEGLQTAEEMLKAAMADYTVRTTCVAAIDEHGNLILDESGQPLIVESARATIRDDVDGDRNALAIVGKRYVPVQNSEVLTRALAIVGSSKGGAVVDTCGVLDEGRKFFASLDLGSLIIDPLGANDSIARNLLVFTGHDGETAITYANTNVRAVCQNTVRMGLSTARSTFKAKHTSNVESVLQDAQTALGMSTAWADAFTDTAERMLATTCVPGSNSVDRVLKVAFPVNEDGTDVSRRNRDDNIAHVKAIWDNPRNAGKAGHNGWTLYNAVVEFLDHGREGDVDRMAILSMDQNSWVSKRKVATQQAVLALA
jgi:phage/plasmid-like protein (TIGR03299 family)